MPGTILSGREARRIVADFAEALEGGRRPEELVKSLERGGLPHEEAVAIVARAIRALRGETADRVMWPLVGGSLLLLASLGLTVGTYLAASSSHKEGFTSSSPGSGLSVRPSS